MADSNEMFDTYFQQRQLGNKEVKGGVDRLPWIEHGEYRLVVTSVTTAKSENSGMVTSLKFYVEKSAPARFEAPRPHNPEESRCCVTWMWDSPTAGKFVEQSMSKFIIALFGLESLGYTAVPKFPGAMSPQPEIDTWRAFAKKLNDRHADLRSPQNIARGMLIDLRTFKGAKGGDFVNLDFAHVPGQKPEDIAARRAALDAQGF